MTKKHLIKSSFSVMAIGLLAFNAVSCASSKKTSKANSYEQDYEDGLYLDESEDVAVSDELSVDAAQNAPEMTDTFLGDFNPILLKETICLLKAGKKMKPKELSKNYIIPRKNTVEIHFRDLANQLCIILDKAEREKLISAANQFLEEYETKTIRRDKVNRKTAYYVSKTPLYFGVTGYNNGTDTCEYYTNSEIFNKHAYFLINFVPSRSTEGSGFTPKEKIYFSPTQLRDFIETLDQNYLNEQVSELRRKAYTY